MTRMKHMILAAAALTLASGAAAQTTGGAGATNVGAGSVETSKNDGAKSAMKSTSMKSTPTKAKVKMKKNTKRPASAAHN